MSLIPCLSMTMSNSFLQSAEKQVMAILEQTTFQSLIFNGNNRKIISEIEIIKPKIKLKTIPRLCIPCPIFPNTLVKYKPLLHYFPFKHPLLSFEPIFVRLPN